MKRLTLALLSIVGTALVACAAEKEEAVGVGDSDLTASCRFESFDPLTGVAVLDFGVMKLRFDCVRPNDAEEADVYATCSSTNYFIVTTAKATITQVNGTYKAAMALVPNLPNLPKDISPVTAECSLSNAAVDAGAEDAH